MLRFKFLLCVAFALISGYDVLSRNMSNNWPIILFAPAVFVATYRLDIYVARHHKVLGKPWLALAKGLFDVFSYLVGIFVLVVMLWCLMAPERFPEDVVYMLSFLTGRTFAALRIAKLASGDM